MVLTVTYDRSRTRFMTSVRECETGRDGGICNSQFLPCVQIKKKKERQMPSDYGHVVCFAFTATR